jgi:hypothetical protein
MEKISSLSFRNLFGRLVGDRFPGRWAAALVCLYAQFLLAYCSIAGWLPSHNPTELLGIQEGDL